MKILTTIIVTIIRMIFIAFCVLSAVFILSIVMPDNAQKVVDIIRSLIS